MGNDQQKRAKIKTNIRLQTVRPNMEHLQKNY